MRILRFIAMAIAAALAVALCTATVASASSEDALARCQRGFPADSSVGTYELDGRNPGWTIPGLSTIRPGNVVKIVGRGSVHYGGVFGLAGEWGPAGNGTVADRAWSYPGASQFSVAANWNPTGEVVRFDTCTVLGNGYGPHWLLMGINDSRGDFGDNSGSYQVSVQVYAA